MSQDAYSMKEMLTEMRLDQREHNERAIRIEAGLNEVIALAKKTNGRVSVLETRSDSQEKDINRFKAIYGTITAIIGVAWAAITFYFK